MVPMGYFYCGELQICRQRLAVISSGTRICGHESIKIMHWDESRRTLLHLKLKTAVSPRRELFRLVDSAMYRDETNEFHLHYNRGVMTPYCTPL